MRTYRTPGFTLIELIVVIVILGILAAVAAPKFVNFRDDAERTVVESFVSSLRTAETFALGKLMLCKVPAYSGKSSVRFWGYIQLDHQEPSPAPDCDTFVGTGNGETIGLGSLRNQIFADPDAHVLAGNEQGKVIAFTTKTGRSIRIVKNDSGDISWTADPAY